MTQDDNANLSLALSEGGLEPLEETLAVHHLTRITFREVLQQLGDGASGITLAKVHHAVGLAKTPDDKRRVLKLLKGMLAESVVNKYLGYLFRAAVGGVVGNGAEKARAREHYFATLRAAIARLEDETKEHAA